MGPPGRTVPHDVVERAKSAFPLRTPPDGLIPLIVTVIDDSDDTQPVEQRLTFERSGLSVRVRVVAGPDVVAVQVDVDPPTFDAAELEVQDPAGGVRSVTPDSSSPGDHPSHLHEGSVRFALPPAIVRLHLWGSPGSAHLYSEWFRL
jgi:hypothetical protein